MARSLLVLMLGLRGFGWGAVTGDLEAKFQATRAALEAKMAAAKEHSLRPRALFATTVVGEDGAVWGNFTFPRPTDQGGTSSEHPADAALAFSLSMWTLLLPCEIIFKSEQYLRRQEPTSCVAPPAERRGLRRAARHVLRPAAGRGRVHPRPV